MSIRTKIKLIIGFILDINQDVFQVSLITYLVFLLIEEFKKGFVSYSFNLNILLILLIVSGALTIFVKEEKKARKKNPTPPRFRMDGILPPSSFFKVEKKSEEITKKDWLFILGLSVLGAFLIFYKTKELG